MNELDLLNLVRSAGQEVSGDFAQVTTITFAMVVAIYYFLHQAGPRMKVFAFALYTSGMMMYYGMMIQQSSVTQGGLIALHQIPSATRSLPTQWLLGIKDSWVGTAETILVNAVFWILWLGTSYLLFFWEKPREGAES